jgi:hypothetical protein
MLAGFVRQLLLLCGRRRDRISPWIALIAFVALVSLGTLLAYWATIAFFALRSLGTRRTWIALRTFKTSPESDRCNERSYQGQEPHALPLCGIVAAK